MKANAIKMEVAIALPADTYDQGRHPKRHCKKTRRSKKRKSKTFSEIDINTFQQPSSPPRELYPELSDKEDDFVADSGGDQTTISEILDTSFSSAFGITLSFEQRPPMLRPVDVPKAPNNSTQFLMDEHEDSILYFSFETPLAAPPPRLRRSTDGTTTSTRSETSGSPDPSYPAAGGSCDYDDYYYESSDDKDDFFKRDFELSYRSAREEELFLLSRNELVNKFIDLEERALSLDKNEVDGGRGPTEGPEQLIGRLQDDLLKLQEENTVLKKSIRSLRPHTIYVSSSHELSMHDDDDFDDDERTLSPEPPPRCPTDDDEMLDIDRAEDASSCCSSVCSNQGRCNLGYCSCNDSDDCSDDFGPFGFGSNDCSATSSSADEMQE